MNTRRALQACLLALCALYLAWFGPRQEWAALAIFAIPAALCVLSLRHAGSAAFWSGVLALGWFSHGVMVAWTRAGERVPALAEIALALAIVAFASLPGLRGRFGKARV